MSQTNNTNTGASNINRNNNAGRDRRGRGGSGGRCRGGCGNNCRNNTIARYSFEGKMKEGPLFKLTISEGGQQTTQYKKIIDALPVLCADKGFRYIDEIICTNKEEVESTFLPAYPDANQWSTTHEVYVKVVDKSQAVVNGLHPLKAIMANKTIITDPNLQKKLLSTYNQKSKLKAQEWSKLNANVRL